MNNSYNVYEKIAEEDRKNWHLIIDAVYKADPTKPNISAEGMRKWYSNVCAGCLAETRKFS